MKAPKKIKDTSFEIYHWHHPSHDSSALRNNKRLAIAEARIEVRFML
jgi:hypothetical protein